MTPEEQARLLLLAYDYRTEKFDEIFSLGVHPRDGLHFVSPEHKRQSDRNAKDWRKRMLLAGESAGLPSEFIRSIERSQRPMTFNQIVERYESLSREELDFLDAVFPRYIKEPIYKMKDAPKVWLD